MAFFYCGDTEVANRKAEVTDRKAEVTDRKAEVTDRKAKLADRTAEVTAGVTFDGLLWNVICR